MAANVTTKFSPGDRVYYPIYAIAEISTALVTNVFIDDSGLIKYDIMQVPLMKDRYNILESELLTFAEAKADLLAWLATQTIKITNLSGI